MDVRLLKELLDDYGDHLPVKVLVDEESELLEGGDVLSFTIGTQYINGELVVCLLVDHND